ncbi:MAG: glycosyltransferase family 4 protein [Planctomycetota bacterium]|jgi:glycosyltransferase involved in cell wall biosynthesis
MKTKSKIAIITTVDRSLDGLFPEFFPFLIEKGYDVVGICADGPFAKNVVDQGIRVIEIPMTREITPLRDLKCLYQMYRVFRREKFDIIHYSTPKAALLAAVAGHLVGCPARLYTLRGLVHTGLSGFRKKFAKYSEKISCRAAHRIIAISKSLKEEAVQEGILEKERIEVLGSGSSKGVNIHKFQLTKNIKSNAAKIRDDLGIRDDDILIGYAGRFTPEKGLVELYQACMNIRKIDKRIYLIWIGYQDHRRPLPEKFFISISNNPGVFLVPWTKSIVSYMAATDIFVLPSYRDGFGNVLIEAAALEKPVIGTDISGVRDALVDGVNGMLVTVKDVVSLEKALKELIDNPDRRIQMGKSGREWVVENFDRSVVWKRLIDVYEDML